ncbi:hypothetical protein Emed_000685 [Eimeria media]
MEYDEQVSARLHMSLDEIIGQEQHDESTQLKKRKPRRVPPGRLSGPPPFGMGPRPPYHLPVRVDSSWPRVRHVGGVFLMPSNGAHPPPPPAGAGPGMRPSRMFPAPPRPGAVDIVYPPRRPLLGPYGAPRAAQPGLAPCLYAAALPLGSGLPRAGWKRSRYPDEVRGGELGDPQAHHHPMGHQMALGAGGSHVLPHMVGDMKGSVHNQMHGVYDARGPQQAGCENRSAAEYYDPPYARDVGHGYGALPGEEFSYPSNNALPYKVEDRNRYDSSDPSTRARDYSHPTGPFPVREAEAASGSSAGAPSGDCREYTVIVSNVPKDLPAVEIQEAFSCMGTVLRTDIMLNSKGEHTGRVCIAFASAEAAKTAVAQFDEGDLNGNTIRVFAE